MTHSVTKSLLSSVVGLAFDRGLIRSIDDLGARLRAADPALQSAPVGNKADRVGAPDLIDLFDTPHNRTITWDHCCARPATGKARSGASPTGPTGRRRNPTMADAAAQQARHRLQIQRRARERAGARGAQCLAPAAAAGAQGDASWTRSAPPTPGAGSATRIRGSCSTALSVQSVTGGGHWGGGMFINAYDMARFGYLTLQPRQVEGPPAPLRRSGSSWALTPTPAEPTYGFMNWFLNTRPASCCRARRRALSCTSATAPTSSMSIRDNDLVAVVRWIEGGAMDGFVKRLIAAASKS